MIGTNVRGLRHLWRLSDSSLKEILVNTRDYGYEFCHVMKTKKNSPVGEKLVIFNLHYNWGHGGVGSYLHSGIMSDEDIKFISTHYSRVIEFDYPGLRQEFPYFYDITLLPDNFEEEYNKFISSNAKMIRTLCGKYGYDPSQPFSKRAFMYTDGSKNFYQWAISSYYQNGTSMTSIRGIMMWNETYGQMAKNLKKNTITAYNSKGDIMALSEELRLLRRDKRINDVINIFNTAQKKILRGAEFSDKDKETLSKFYRLSETKKINFVRKMSTIEDYAEIMRQMRHITSTHFDWNKESFMDFIKNVEGMKYETIFDNGDVVLVRVEDFETVKHLAKTTNWCISKNKTYWNQYVEHRGGESVQYMVFDFSKKEDDLLSIIGFTTEYNKGITHAHDFTNHDMMESNRNSERVFLKSFITKFQNENGIYNVLKSCGIDINLVAQYDKPLYEWNKESMYTYLYECVNKSNIDILCDKDNKVAISIKDSNVRYFLGDTYIDNFDESNWTCQHIIFMNFSMSEYDPNRIQFAIIRNQGDDQEDYCTGIFNEHIEGINASFEVLLSQYGLPYNIIRRTDNIYVRISGAFRSYNSPALKELLKSADEETIKEAFYDYIGSETAINIIASSIADTMSFDMLDVFYDNGIKLTTYFDSSLVGTIVKIVANKMVMHGRSGNMNGKYEIPTKEQIDSFFANNCSSLDEAFYIGSYLALKKIIENEKGVPKGNNLYRKLTNIIAMARKPGEVFEDLLMSIANQLNFNERQDAIINWIFYASLYGSEEMKEYAKEHILIHNCAKRIWDEVESRRTVSQALNQQTEVHQVQPAAMALDLIDNGPDDDFEFFDEDEDFVGDEEEFEPDMAEDVPAEAGF